VLEHLDLTVLQVHIPMMGGLPPAEGPVQPEHPDRAQEQKKNEKNRDNEEDLPEEREGVDFMQDSHRFSIPMLLTVLSCSKGSAKTRQQKGIAGNKLNLYEKKGDRLP
jgi:hypothetical protein